MLEELQELRDKQQCLQALLREMEPTFPFRWAIVERFCEVDDAIHFAIVGSLCGSSEKEEV